MTTMHVLTTLGELATFIGCAFTVVIVWLLRGKGQRSGFRNHFRWLLSFYGFVILTDVLYAWQLIDMQSYQLIRRSFGRLLLTCSLFSVLHDVWRSRPQC